MRKGLTTAFLASMLLVLGCTKAAKEPTYIFPDAPEVSE